jgi:DNA modification methylase
MKIVDREIRDLIPAEYNPRHLSEKQAEHLEASLKRFGAVDPAIINTHPDRKNIIIGGHQRLKTAQRLGWETFPCVELELDKEKERELNIRLNKNTGGWDYDALANYFEVEELTEWGFSDEELFADIEAEEIEAEEDNYEEPEDIKVDVVLGDLIEIGPHRLLCGDSTDSDQVAKLMNGKKADMVFTDPPYGVAVKNTQGTILGDEDLDVFINCLPIIKIFSNDDSHYYVWCASGDMFPPSLQAYSEHLPFQNILPIRVTHENKRGKKGAFKLNFETCIFGNNNEKGFNSSFKFKVSETTLNDNRYKGNGKLKVYPALWDEERSTEHNMNLVHPTQKNVKMIEFYVEISSNINNIILDLFLGSGSTMVASHQLKRKCYGMELDPKYCQVIIDRMKKLDDTLEIKINGEPYGV